MQFYKFWATADGSAIAKDGETVFRSAYGFSNENLEEALDVARRRANQVAANWVGSAPSNFGEYYPSGAIREEIVEKFEENSGVTALISRNSYGCLVLNTPNVFFADIDIPQKKVSWLSFFKKKKQPVFEQELIQNIESVINAYSELGLRLYRTKLGYRILVTSKTIDSKDAESDKLLKQLGSDQLYIRLCGAQNCYRARLTPKPWRCGAERPPFRFPFIAVGTEEAYREWESGYNRIAEKFATCALVGEFGRESLDPQVESVLKLHDHYCLNGNRPLA